MILGSACGSTFKEDLLAEGIPLNMAEYRKEQVSNVVYTLSFDIPSRINRDSKKYFFITKGLDGAQKVPIFANQINENQSKKQCLT